MEKDRCIPIFITKSPKVPNQEPMIWKTQTSCRVSISIPDIEKEILLVMTLMRQHYYPISYNNDPMDENDITLEAVEEEVSPLTTSLQQGWSPF